MNNILDKLNWRYATKEFDSNKKISDDELETLLEAARLTPSSYGLQPYHIFVIEDKAIREQLKAVSWGQSQITDASHLIVLANKPTFDESLVDTYLDSVVTERGVSRKNLEAYEQMMKGSLIGLPDDVKNNWTSKQTYIILGNLMTIAAEMEIDACPIEGFENTKYNEILGLEQRNLNAAVVLAVGHRSEEDQTQHYAKVRYSKDQLITHI